MGRIIDSLKDSDMLGIDRKNRVVYIKEGVSLKHDTIVEDDAAPLIVEDVTIKEDEDDDVAYAAESEDE